MKQPTPNKPPRDSAAAYKAAYEAQYAAASKELQAKLERAKVGLLYAGDKEVVAFCKSVAKEAEGQAW